MIEILIFIATAACSYLGVAWFERWSRKRELLDIPNDRSSHKVPTPRGGGIVIVAICVFVYVFSSLAFSKGIAWGYLGGAVLVAGISWLDDVRSVSFIVRYFIHSVAAGLVIWNFGTVNVFHLQFIAGNTYLWIVAIALTYLWIVWVINAYNFMDGIDGIAGVQGLVTAAGWLVISSFLGNSEIALYSTAIFGATLGFLIHNWHPAKVFMGDVGSAFLGFTFAVLPFLAVPGQNESAEFIPFISILLLWPFLFDTVLTFIRRLLRGERVWMAHRDHLYQQMIKSGYTHNFVSKIYAISASLVAASGIAAVVFGGQFVLVSLLTTAFLTTCLLVVARSKKRLT